MGDNGRHFVLVHGACHGAWCWYKLIPLLKSEGHRVTALDMASSGVHPESVDQVRSSSDHSEPLIEFMESLTAIDDRVILVGHSMGGINISLAMERFPEKISVAVFVTALSPGPGFSHRTISEESRRELDNYMDSQFSFNNGLDNPPTSILLGPNFLSSKLYHLSPLEDLTLATLLVRPTPLFDELGLLNETALTREKYGSVRRIYIGSDQDAVVKEDFQRWMIKNNPADEVKVIYGSDHMVMFSKPQELCSCLQEIAENYQ